LNEQGIWTGMISGTVVQTLILAIITLRCEWEKEVMVEIGKLWKPFHFFFFFFLNVIWMLLVLNYHSQAQKAQILITKEAASRH